MLSQVEDDQGLIPPSISLYIWRPERLGPAWVIYISIQKFRRNHSLFRSFEGAGFLNRFSQLSRHG